MEITIKHLTMGMTTAIPNLLQKYGVQRSPEYLRKCFDEQANGIRNSLIAFGGEQPVGLVHLLQNSLYPRFASENIPEINDLVVAKNFQRLGIGESLVRACEELAREKGHSSIGLGVGLYQDYGSAHRLYFRMSYMPDGQGLVYDNVPVRPGTSVFVDDDLLIYLVKELKNYPG